mmetsp:Transcript_3862/g.8686  ORF Transcript_3862/g.8686 Transcript_3862/m.8686 type:complete len:112 (-) Transcript_3862:1266-1601(-)
MHVSFVEGNMCAVWKWHVGNNIWEGTTVLNRNECLGKRVRPQHDIATSLEKNIEAESDALFSFCDMQTRYLVNIVINTVIQKRQKDLEETTKRHEAQAGLQRGERDLQAGG